MSARSRDGAAADGDSAAGAIPYIVTLSAADTRAIFATVRRDGAAANGDVAAGAVEVSNVSDAATADARSVLSARSRDGAAIDDDVAANEIAT